MTTPPAPDPRPDPLLPPAASPSPWLPPLAGLLAATTAAWLLTPGFLAGLPFPRALLAVLFWLTATILAGAAGTLLGRFSVLRRAAWPPPLRPLLDALPAWLLLPPLFLLSEHRSPWALAFLSLSSAALAASVPRTPAAAFEPPPPPSLFAGLPPPEPGRLQAFLVSVSLECALVLLAGRHWLPGSLLLVTGSFLGVRRVLAASVQQPRPGLQPASARAGAAAMLAIVFLLPLLVTGGHGFFGPAAGASTHASRKPSPTPRPAALPDDGYRGIILWPVAPKDQAIVAPPPETAALGGRKSKPQIIPFNGDYWYFQAPRHDPGLNPHIAHGDPVAVSIFSASWIPLAMQAHQALASPIGLAGCSRLAVTVENGDNHPGEIALGVVLRDTSRPGKPFLFLTPRPLLSTEPGHFASKPHPVDEVLDFPIPARRPIRSFDQITVIYFPSDVRSTLGARVSIRQFELLPQ